MTNNIWLKFSNARKIAAELQIKYFGLHCGPMECPLEDVMLMDMLSHPLYDDFYLEPHWDDHNCLLWVQIGVLGSECVPR